MSTHSFRTHSAIREFGLWVIWAVVGVLSHVVSAVANVVTRVMHIRVHMHLPATVAGRRALMIVVLLVGLAAFSSAVWMP